MKALLIIFNKINLQMATPYLSFLHEKRNVIYYFICDLVIFDMTKQINYLKIINKTYLEQICDPSLHIKNSILYQTFEKTANHFILSEPTFYSFYNLANFVRQ